MKNDIQCIGMTLIDPNLTSESMTFFRSKAAEDIAIIHWMEM